MGRRNPDKTKAIEEGRKFYVGGKACKKCGCIIKYVSTQNCHFCAKKSGYEKLMNGTIDKYKSPEKDAERLRKWRKNNPEKYQAQWLRDETTNARAAKRRASKRDQTPDLTLEEKQVIIDLYSEAKRLTIETGVPHEVDHIHPIAKGGLHHPDNLQILTRYDNRKKGAKVQ